MKIINALRRSLLTRPLFAMAVALVTVFASPSAFAQFGGGAGAVTYNIPEQIQQGNMPYTASYTLLITSPAGLARGGNYQVSLNLTLLSTPGNISTSQALSFVSISSNTSLIGSILNLLGSIVGNTQTGAATIGFTGPSQTVAVTVTTNIPLGNWAGGFGYQITTSGWNSSLGVTDQGAFINDTVSIPQTVPALPSVQIVAPVDQTQYTWVAGGPAISIPYSFVGSTTDGSPVIALNGTVNGMDLGATPSGLNVANTNATASGSFLVTTPGTYTVTTNDANANGVASSSVMITVAVSAGPPSVVIDTPPANSTYTLTGSSVSVPFTFTGTSQYGGITNLTATLDGTPVTVTSGDYGNLVALGSGTMNLTSSGTHELAVTATDNFGTASTSEVVIVVTQTPLIPPTANINSPTANQVFTTVAGTPVSVPLTFNGTTTGDGITNLTATLDGNVVVFTPAGIGTQTATGSASVSYSVAGNHTLQVTTTNDGGTASTTQHFSVVTTSPTTNTLAVAITKPAPNSTYAIPTVGGSVTIADGFVSNSTAASGVTALSVTLNGSPVSVTPTAFGKPTVTATGNLTISVAGTYTIAVKATDQYGNATASETITVTAPAPCPKVTITKPCDGATFQLGTASCPLWVPVSLCANTTPGSTLSTLTLTLNGQPVTLGSLSGLGSTSANGTVNLKITTAGNYTLVATTTSGGVSATDTNVFTVTTCGGNSGGWGGWGSGGGDDNGGWGDLGNGYSWGGGCWNVTQYTCNPPPCNISWEQSWSCNTTQKGGSSLPLCFHVKYTGSNCTSYWSNYFGSFGGDYEQSDKSERSCWGSSGYLNCLWGNVPDTNHCLNGNWDNIKGCGTVASDTSVKCVVYELYANGTCGKPQTYTCGGWSWVSTGWWGYWSYNKGTGCNIDSNDQYSCNFPTAKGTHTYRCDVYYNDSNSGKDCLLGSSQFKTK